MDLAELEQSLAQPLPPKGLDSAAVALWWDAILRQGAMQWCGMLVSALAFAFQRLVGGSQWRYALFSRSVGEN
jgi:hypothetical protein